MKTCTRRVSANPQRPNRKLQMTDSKSKQILSRLSDEDFVDREVEVARVCGLARRSNDRGSHGRESIAILLGAPRAGKTEILRRSFDRLFNECGETLPFYYALRSSCLDPGQFARDYFSQFLAQFVAFRRNDPRLISAAVEPLGILARAAPADDYLCVRSMTDSFARAAQSDDASSLVRFVLSAPAVAAAHTGLKPLALIDDWSLIARADLRGEFLRSMVAARWEKPGTAYAVTGLQRVAIELIPADQESFDGVELIRLGRIGDESLEKLTRRRAELLGIEITDSTIELIAQQLNRDFFYTRAILDAAASRGSSLRTFLEFERIYAGEVLSGHIGHYLEAMLRDVAPASPQRRAALEALALVIEADSPVPIDAVSECMLEHAPDSEALLEGLRSREMLDISCGFLTASGDPVLADYVRAKYRSEIAGAPRPAAGEELVGEKQIGRAHV